jgi:hypothetical protein
MFNYEYNLNPIFEMEIEVAFNFIYTMHYNAWLMVFWDLFNCQHGTWIEPFTFNTSKMGCILHLPLFIFKNVTTEDLTFILEWINDFFTFFELSTCVHELNYSLLIC